MSQIEYAPVSLFRSPTTLSGTHPVKLGLAGSVTRVQSGTPLIPSDEGWVVSHNGFGEFVASTGSNGGEVVDGFRLATVDFHREPAYGLPYFKVGKRYAITDVDDKGMCEFELDPEGPYLAVTRSAMLLDMTVSAMYLHAMETKDEGATVAA